MIIKKMSGEGVYPTVSLGDETLSIGGHAMSLDDIWQDVENIVTLKSGEAFLSNIIVPPHLYEVVDTGEVDQDGHPIFENQRQAMDVGRLRVVIWPQEEVLP